MSTVCLRPHVHAAILDEDIVFLDVVADRYTCLAGAGVDARLADDRVWLELNPPFARQIVEAGLAASHAVPSPPRTGPPPRGERSGLPPDVPDATLRDAAPLLHALADTAVHYRRRSFADIVAAGSRPRTGAPKVTPELEAAVARFHGWIPYAPLSAQCLLRAFILLRLLRRQGLDANWVFGVQTWPFHAHCWLQVEDLVLDDPAERTWGYTPVMVL